jgi:hypothetical protein
VIPPLRSAYLVSSAVPGTVLLATRVFELWGPKWSGCIIPDWVGPFVIAVLGAYLASGVLAVMGGLLWLRAGLRGRWDSALAVTSVLNALPLLYVVIAQPDHL